VLVKITPGINCRGVVKRQRSQSFGKLISARHYCTVDEDRYRRDAPFQPLLDLDTTRVCLVEDAEFSAALWAPPLWPDYDEQNFDLAERLSDLRAEIDAERNIIDIHKNGVVTVLARQPVPNSPGHRVRIGSSIRNRDFGHDPVSAHSGGDAANILQ
jgi:hypothetical protein